MHIFKDNNEAWIKGFVEGCINIKGAYTGVPPIPVLKVPHGVDPLIFYYEDGKIKGEIYAIQTLSGNNKSLRN